MSYSIASDLYFFYSTSASLLVSQGSCELKELAEEW